MLLLRWPSALAPSSSSMQHAENPNVGDCAHGSSSQDGRIADGCSSSSACARRVWTLPPLSPPPPSPLVHHALATALALALGHLLLPYALAHR